MTKTTTIFTRHPRIVVLVAALFWMVVIGYALSLLWIYENSPGRSGTPTATWPTDSSIRTESGLPTLVVFIHPHCPCSRATIGELAILMAHSQRRVSAVAVFVKPKGVNDDWEKTDLWSSASQIPGVKVITDNHGIEARRFRSETSGHAALYSAEGRLLFSGGITRSRGHSGDNDGRTAIQSLLAGNGRATANTLVFGCPLDKTSLAKQSEESCNALHGN